MNQTDGAASAAAAPPAPSVDPRIRAMLWVLLLVYILNFLDRQIVNILAEPIARDLRLSDSDIGLLTGMADAG